MLTLIIGRGKSGKTTKLLEAVKLCPASEMAQQIIIVPEQLSHMTERKLSQLCGDSVSYVSEVLSFTRLYNRVCSISGGGARPVLDASGRILTARLALESIRHRLKVFASAAGKPEFLSGMVNMIDELKSYDITAAILQNTAKQTTGLFSEKLSELALILSAYEAVTAQSAADPRDNMTLLQKKLREGDYARNRHFFVDGFTDFSSQETGVLRQLLMKCQTMTVTVPCDDIFGTSTLFAPGRETALELIRMAEECGKPVKIITTQHLRSLPNELKVIEKSLFDYSTDPCQDNVDCVHISGFADKLAECRRCGAVLKAHAMKGMRYRDMMVCAGDAESYGPLLETVLRTMGVPLYRTQKQPILTHRAIAFVLLAMEAAVDHLETETVTAYIKTGYSGVDTDLCDAMENYAYTWKIRGSKWQSPWKMHPEGYDGRFTPEIEKELELLNEQKELALAPILSLRSGFKSAQTVLDQMTAIYEFLEQTKLHELLEQEITAYTRSGQQAKAQETAQIWGGLMDCLQQITRVLGKTPLKPDELLRVTELALGQYQIGTIPAVLDAVNFGGIDKARGEEPKLLYVLGANEGSIPTVVSGGSLLSERERNILRNDFSIKLAPDSEGNLERQLLTAYSAFTAPTDALYISYCMQDAGEQKQKSFLVGRVEKLLPNVLPIKAAETEYTVQTAAENLLSSDGSVSSAALAEAINRAAKEITDLALVIARGRSASMPRDERVSRIESESLFGMPVNLTASKLDQLGNCPLSFFLNYGLKARVRKEASFDAAEFGTFVHYILEKTVHELSQNDKIQPLDRKNSETMVKKYLSEYAKNRLGKEEQTARQVHIFQRNGEEATILLEELSRELSNSDFHPAAFELQFGGKNGLPPLEVQGSLGSGSLTGFVDRADIWDSGDGEYLRIVDYKSGTKKFDYTELYGGVGMQMLLYLFALKNSGIPESADAPIPAGVLYMSAKRPFVSGDAEDPEVSSTKRSGLVLGEEDVLEAMEHGGTYAFLPVKKTKSGLGDYAVSGQQLDILESFVQKRMGQAVDQVLNGEFIAKPFYRGRSHDPCGYCDYSEICQKDAQFRRQFYQEALSAREFWEKIGGEEDG